MTHGMIRSLALLRVMGADPIVPGIGSDPNRDRGDQQASPPGEETRTSSKGLAILLASLAAAIIGASAITSNLHTDRYACSAGRTIEKACSSLPLTRR